jgi:catechol 2,3-dioxygenase-like lactoylglutathione lyase family enzyme
MLNDSNIIAFVPTTDAERSKAFYQKSLGLTLVSENPFAMEFDANGTMLRIATVEQLSPAQYTVLGWDVSDIYTKVNELTSKGVVFERYDGLNQDESNICSFPDGAKVAWFKDPDGNTLSLTQFA